MRARSIVIAACLLIAVLTAAPGVEARPEPVGGCDSGATLEVCSVQCIHPPCDQYVCINNAVQRVCTNS